MFRLHSGSSILDTLWQCSIGGISAMFRLCSVLFCQHSCFFEYVPAMFHLCSVYSSGYDPYLFQFCSIGYISYMFCLCSVYAPVKFRTMFRLELQPRSEGSREAEKGQIKILVLIENEKKFYGMTLGLPQKLLKARPQSTVCLW